MTSCTRATNTAPDQSRPPSQRHKEQRGKVKCKWRGSQKKNKTELWQKEKQHDEWWELSEGREEVEAGGACGRLMYNKWPLAESGWDVLPFLPPLTFASLLMSCLLFSPSSFLPSSPCFLSAAFAIKNQARRHLFSTFIRVGSNIGDRQDALADVSCFSVIFVIFITRWNVRKTTIRAGMWGTDLLGF